MGRGFASEDVVEEAALAGRTRVVVELALAPPVALFKAGLEEEMLAESVGLFDEGVWSPSVEGVAKDFVCFEED